MSLFLSIYETPFMRDALIAGTLTGGLLGYLGLFVILRRQIFLGAALPQFAAFGVVAGMAVGLSALPAALLGVALGAAAASMAPRRIAIGTDGLVGLGYAIATAGVLLGLAVLAPTETHGLTILGGDILGANPDEIMVLAGVTTAIALVHSFAWKEFVLVSYDGEYAATTGRNPGAWNALLLATIGAGVAASLKTSGAILSFAALIGPAAAALLVARRFRSAAVVAILLGATMAGLGLSLSYVHELPSGPTMALTALAPILPTSAYRLWRWR